jgi:hypothetical protein
LSHRRRSPCCIDEAERWIAEYYDIRPTIDDERARILDGLHKIDRTTLVIRNEDPREPASPTAYVPLAAVRDIVKGEHQ